MHERQTRSTDPIHRLTEHVAKRLRERCAVQPGSRLLVGVSGGVDSVALLRTLLEMAPRFDLELLVGHFDHALRQDSKQDVLFVQELATGLGLPVHVGRWDHPAPGEDAARHARLRFLEETAVQTGCQALVLAHHLDDQIETVLLRLSRGTGLRGWLGMAWRRDGVVAIARPLLDLRKANLVQFLDDRGQAWREDPTNQDPNAARNRVRHQVMPALETALESGWLGRWGDSLDELRQIWDWLRMRALGLLERTKLPPHPGTRGLESLDLRLFRQADDPIRRQALELWIEPHLDRQITRRHLIEVSNLVQNGQSGQGIDLPDGLRLVLEQGHMTLLQTQGEATEETGFETAKPSLEVLPTPGSTAWSEITRRPHRVEARPWIRTLPAQAETLVAADHLAPPFAIRTPQAGDRVCLLGAPGSRKLHRILQDHKVPRRLRGHWPVVVDTLGILWIPGLGVAERGRLHPDTKHALRIRLSSTGRTSIEGSPKDAGPRLE